MQLAFLIFAKTLLSMGWEHRGAVFACQGIVCRDILHRKAGAGDAVGKGMWSGDRPFEKSAHILVESPVKNAF
ncbi:MAG: hypothetical protein A2X95_09535 [Syntrophobacterales bacterium GWF2_56_9]|nr:MAG: hypothetical protein A2X95_09535 [Syntrophobacterales bacterium GWF2_56_9]